MREALAPAVYRRSAYLKSSGSCAVRPVELALVAGHQRPTARRRQPTSRLQADFPEAPQLEAESVPSGPIILDTVRLSYVEKVLADHGDHQILGSKNAECRVGAARLNRSSAIIDRQSEPPGHRHRDGGALTCPQTPGSRQLAEERHLLGAADARLQNDARTDRLSKPLLLMGISIDNLRSDMIRDHELVGTTGKKIHPVDTEEVQQYRRICYYDGWPFAHEPDQSPRATWARRSRVSPRILKALLSSRTRPREISSRRYASMARWAISLRSSRSR